GSARHSAVGFAVGGKGYVGLGYDGEKALKDFYQYDPTANTWTKKADFPGEARFGAVAFTIGDNAYVGLGATPTDKTFSDFYRYNPKTDTWTAITTKFTYKKAYAFAFVINNVAYVGGGTSNNAYPEEFFSFDGTEWKKLGDRSEEHTSELQSRENLVCRLLLEKKKKSRDKSGRRQEARRGDSCLERAFDRGRRSREAAPRGHGWTRGQRYIDAELEFYHVLQTV